jgi:hypothetical protein
VWFIDDRFPAHFRHGHKRKPVKCCFPAWWIGLIGLFFWPVHSTDLHSLEFFIWGHLRCLVLETFLRQRRWTL